MKNVRKDKNKEDMLRYERELAEVRRQKERVEERFMAQYKSPSPPKKPKGMIHSL